MAPILGWIKTWCKCMARWIFNDFPDNHALFGLVIGIHFFSEPSPALFLEPSFSILFFQTLPTPSYLDTSFQILFFQPSAQFVERSPSGVSGIFFFQPCSPFFRPYTYFFLPSTSFSQPGIRVFQPFTVVLFHPPNPTPPFLNFQSVLSNPCFVFFSPWRPFFFQPTDFAFSTHHTQDGLPVPEAAQSAWWLSTQW